jgi:hypothetical protein
MAIPQVVAYLNDLGYIRYSQLPVAVEAGLVLFFMFLLFGGFGIEIHVLRISSWLFIRKPGAIQHRQAMRAAFLVSLVIVFGGVGYLAGSLAVFFLF